MQPGEINEMDLVHKHRYNKADGSQEVLVLHRVEYNSRKSYTLREVKVMRYSYTLQIFNLGWRADAQGIKRSMSLKNDLTTPLKSLRSEGKIYTVDYLSQSRIVALMMDQALLIKFGALGILSTQKIDLTGVPSPINQISLYKGSYLLFNYRRKDGDFENEDDGRVEPGESFYFELEEFDRVLGLGKAASTEGDSLVDEEVELITLNKESFRLDE